MLCCFVLCCSLKEKSSDYPDIKTLTFNFTDPEFADPTEMLKFVYNSCTASGRIGDGLDLVHGQKRHLAFDYKFATQEGAVIFNIHALDPKDEIQLLLFDLRKENMPIWKQMCCLEIVAAIMAETLMEMSVNIMMSPEEIHWPMGCVTRPGSQTQAKKGKKTTKKQGGIFGSIVYKYALEKGVEYTKQGESVASKAKTIKKTKEKAKSTAQMAADDDNECQVIAVHEGLPVQERKCMGIIHIIY